ncbi:MAG: transglycosylase domain-containing protein [Candidatus Eisenbacteria bacterium]|nr:transglycosylase domain-containing protein [Candidatus Eisenbacteria bacterium]
MLDGAIRLLKPDHPVVGGSTLATQIEKFRHSPDGVTTNAGEKLRQILSASVRAYQKGERTAPARASIILDYINSIPLAAVPGFGEVIGLGDGLWAWYGMDFETVNHALRDAEPGAAAGSVDSLTGATVRAALSLFIAQRRPTDYLLFDRRALRELTDAYLRVMARDGVITPPVRDAALATRLSLARQSDIEFRLDPARRQATGLVRSRLLAPLGLDGLYELDRVDLDVRTTIDLDLQEKATATLRGFQDAAQVEQARLMEPHLLQKGDPRQVVYGFTLYERRPEGNFLRVQSSTIEGLFSIDEQARLDLGSSAKLRTLVHYLEIVADLHRMHTTTESKGSSQTSTGITQRARDAMDPLTRWAVEYLHEHPQAELPAMLAAAMARSYSANPAERFFTGGGLHTFSNFDRSDNRKVLSVSEAFRNSVNLVFVRLMRDIVHYHVFQRYGTTPRALEGIEDTEKRRLLETFADREGIVFIRRFHAQYRDKSPFEARKRLFEEVSPSPSPLSAIYRFLTPAAPAESLAAFLSHSLRHSRLTDAFVRRLHGEYAPGKLSLADVGHLGEIHPLELWVVRYLQARPGADLGEVIAASAEVRQEVYQWLFKTRSRRTQLQRIRTVVELEAFQDIHQAWQRLGYPFDYLTPSYATTLGCSGDRPGALAELCGIVLNDGLRMPMVRVQGFDAGRGTPYETRLELRAAVGERVLSAAVARTVRDALRDVVATGTARRLQEGIRLSDGQCVPLGGKTGTGDHRYKTFDPGGRLIGDRVVNRNATFVFFIGDRFFGAITAHVSGEAAADYVFSSSLPVQILKTMLPDLAPLLENGNGPTVPPQDHRVSRAEAGSTGVQEAVERG